MGIRNFNFRKRNLEKAEEWFEPVLNKRTPLNKRNPFPHSDPNIFITCPCSAQ